MNLPRLKQLEYMLYYQSPPGCIHHPRQIKPGLEEIEVIVAGYGDFLDVSTGKWVRFGPGTSAWYYEGEFVEVTADAESPYETIVFCYQISNDKAEKKMPFYSKWDNRDSCRSFCFDAYNSYKLQADDPVFLTTCTYARLLWEATQFTRQVKDVQKPLQIQKAVCYIEKHFNEDIHIADIAGAAGVSSSHLHLLFRNYIQTSPNQYMLKLRLAKAQELLSRSSMSVKQICFEAGFSDLKNFCSYFKRQNNLTPTQYRLLTSGNL